MRKWLKGVCVLGLALAATQGQAQTQPSQVAWQVGAADGAGSIAWISTTNDPKTMIVAVWTATPQELGDAEHHKYSGAIFIEEVDCANGQSRDTRAMYYDAQGATINAVAENGPWRQLHSDGGGADDVALAKCAGRVGPAGTGQTSTSTDPETVIKWLKGLTEAAAAKR